MTVQLEIVDVAFGGRGVARYEGKVCFLPFVIPGEAVTARIVRDKKKFAEAELLSVQTASPDRVEPRCPYFGRCGGCAYAYPRQLELKQAQVEQTLKRVGRFAEVPMRPIVASPLDYNYRNRIRVHVEAGVTGFYAHGSRSLIDIAQCPISAPEVNAELTAIRKRSLPDGDYILSARQRGRFFEQTNDAVSQAMLEVVEKGIADGQQLLVDAYCGAGLFAKHLRGRFNRVIGIEENAFAVDVARHGATEGETYIAGDVQMHLGEILTAHDPSTTTVLLDPPAIGVVPRVLDILLGSRPSELVYVSCNPATLARDLATLSPGYELKAVTPLDMFPQTAEIEVVAQLTVRR
jgi:23S rRNA (uracil1939-C5)-methyltransferase